MMNEKLKDEYTNRLFAGILSLKTTAECYQFFRIFAQSRKSNQWRNDCKWPICSEMEKPILK